MPTTAGAGEAGATGRRPRRIAAWTIGLLLAGLLALEAYVRWPSAAPATAIVVPAGTRELVLIVHGSFGAEEPTLVELERRLRGQLRAAGRRDAEVRRYRWAPWSDNRLRAGSHGAAIGAQLGRELAAARGLQRLHLIAHSAGAYLLDPLCESWRDRRAAGGAPPTDRAPVADGMTRPGPDAAAHAVRMTFLDPIGLHGLFDPGWGSRHFGRCADEAEAYVNTDDPAPATDRELRHARTFDVTAAAGRAAFPDGHRWPVQYYLERIAMGAGVASPPATVAAAADAPAP